MKIGMRLKNIGERDGKDEICEYAFFQGKDDEMSMSLSISGNAHKVRAVLNALNVSAIGDEIGISVTPNAQQKITEASA